MNGTTLNFVMAALSIVLIIFVSKRKKLSLKDDLGLKVPKLHIILIWLILFVALIYLDSYLYSLFSDSEIDSWKDKYSLSEKIIRGFAIVILAPVAEELIFRGILYWRIRQTPLKNIGAIVIPAILFSLIHVQYSDLIALGIIFIDGLFYGLARHYSKSVLLAILLHSLANLGAILERL